MLVYYQTEEGDKHHHNTSTPSWAKNEAGRATINPLDEFEKGIGHLNIRLVLTSILLYNNMCNIHILVDVQEFKYESQFT